MLESVKITRRQSEIRQALAGLVGKEKPTEDEVRSIEAMDLEFRQNETRYRAALICEDTERREAGAELETRSGKEWADLMAGFEMRQVALALDEGASLTGQTAEIVQELRSAGGYRGIPVPWAALEQRNTVSSGTPDPIQTRPIIDRLFPASVASQMGAQMISIDSGAIEWPVTTSAVTAGWAATEGGNVATGAAYATTDRAMKPDHTLGVQMRITRKTLKQSGEALEQAIRRDMAGAMGQEMDKAVFLGTGADGQPLGIIPGAATYGITATAVADVPTYNTFLAEVVAFMAGNLITSPGEIRALMRPELFGLLEGTLNTITQTTEYYRLAFLLAGRGVTGTFPSNISVSSNALAAPAGSPLATSMVMTTATGGVAPIFVGAWGAVDVIRDPFTDAQSGGLRITALATMDLTVARPAQLRILTGLELA
ncbi:MAG: phage major capsid protein [Pseudotabrizicola sp.]|uniref:phage major capsid protein n=1 Tax=Pseudotabrizicola sp. TaxID=2939647 RepID=UPI0027258B24|nr:phage major capsid protein [Pseudotabrizicola sp.]MDO9638121.1 phage major capsid protein [Pseudotabrizicola sp.]